MNFFDMHCDTISAIYYRRKHGKQCDLYENDLHIDLKKLKQANYLAQNFAIFIDKMEVPDCFQEALNMIDLFYQELESNKDIIAYAGSYDDLLTNQKNGKISAFLTLEEGAISKGSLSNLRNLYRLGARMTTLTWNYENELASPNNNATSGTDPDPTVPFTAWGLTDLGKEFVCEAEHLGMLLDVSHLSDAGFQDVLDITTRPFVASHSNSRNICGHVRNLTDDMIRQLANRGGVTGINLCPAFLSGPRPEDYHSGGTIEEIITHIKHIESVGGIECIGLGTDFDGIDGHNELPTAATMPLLYDALKKHGFSEEKIEKIFYKNVMRVYKDVL